MKKLLFLGIVVLMVQSLGAVTLPSTSYSPYSASAPSDGTFTTTGGTMVTGSYSVLRSGDDACTSLSDVPTCQTCCNDEYFGESSDCCPKGVCDQETFDECSSLYTSCANDCARSLPLDGGLSILLILSVAGGAVKLLRNRKV